MDAVAAARDLVSDPQLRSDRTNDAGGGAIYGLEPVSTVECLTKEEAIYSSVHRRKLGPKSRKLQNANYQIPICQSTNMSSTKRTKIKST